MNLASLKPITFDGPGVPSALRDDGCKLFPVAPLADSLYRSAKRRVLILFQHVPTEDLRAGRLASGAHGAALANMLKLGREYARSSGLETVGSIGYAVASYNYFKTYHLESNDKRELASKAELKRAVTLIEKLEPHVVVVLGNEPAMALTGMYGSATAASAVKYRGWALKCKKVSGVKIIPLHDITLTNRPSGDDDEDDEESGDEFGEKKLVAQANLLGYASRCVSTVFTKKFVKPYSVEPVVAKPQLIDTIKKFDKFFEVLMRQKAISVDSETNDLARITNQILTLQFSWNARVSYVLPIMHRDSPWKPNQLEYIRQKLRTFYGRRFDPLAKDYSHYLIGQNYKFDMSPLRHWLGLYAIYWPVWDLQAGEYVLDENIKQATSTGAPQYGLAQMALNYGCDAYENSPFLKSERATIRGRPLDENVLHYCALDTQVPFAIHLQQIRRATSQRFRRESYEKIFSRFIVTQMNNLIKIESFMEGRGVTVDPQWLRQLQLANGPLEKLKQEINTKMRESAAVKKANRRIMKRRGVPENSLWGSEQWALNLNKPEHKQVLFIDVLGLEPLKVGKSGEPSIDKFFLKKYKDIPEVALFSDASALDKLSNTYVNKFAKIRREEPDMRKDGRLRPSFGFTDTVTGRSNSTGPNLQQIPSRGKHAKLIKRLFVAPRGSMLVKMDYSAHEIRIWSVISGDEKLGQLFAKGRELRQKWRATENPKYLDAIETVGDIHKLNCQLFFGTDPREVTKEQRDAVKGLVFGSIYGMGPGTLAANLGKDKQYVLDLLDMFFSRYKKASAWLKWAKQHVVDHNYVFSPAGRRRNMFAHLYEGAGALEAAVRRMGSNSPIQGWAADMGHTAATLFLYHFPKVVEEMQLCSVDIAMGGINVMVHDSIEGDFLNNLWYVALQVMQWCATVGCMNYYKTHFGTEYTVPLEVEFELGADESTLEKWDWSTSQLKKIIDLSVENQIKVYPDLNSKEVKRELLSPMKNAKLMKYLDKHYPILA